MNRKLVAHETPLHIMQSKDHFKINDYTYVLLHKLIEDPEYYEVVKKINETRLHPIYLDNSCFELGASLSNDLLYEWTTKIVPSVVILPDTLGNKKATIEQTKEFLNEHPDTTHYGMAVIQGSSPEEMIECYQEFRDIKIEGEEIFMIAIPFVYSWAEKDPIVQANERIKLLHRMNDTRVVDKYRKHHLLGTWWAGEFAYYREYDWVYSVDTSNPVMAAIDGNKYSSAGVIGKPKATFDKVYHMKKGDIDMDLLYHNVNVFKEILNG